MSDIEIPEEYKEKSRQIEQLWEVFLETGENLDRVVLETRNFLEDIGFSRTDAMKKIAQDHRHLKGFSLKSLYRMLPAEEKREKAPHKQKIDNCQNDNYEIPQPAPNIVDVEPEPIIQQPQQEERRTPESPDHSMVQQLNHINIQLKKKIEDLENLMEIRMADKDQRIEQFTILNIGMKKDVERLMDENMKLKSEKQRLETELAKYKRMEELRLAVQRRDIKEWRNPGDKP